MSLALDPSNQHSIAPARTNRMKRFREATTHMCDIEMYRLLRKVHKQNKRILANQELIMTELQKLQAAVAALNTSVSTELAAISAKLASFGDSISATDADAVVQQLNTLKTTIDNETATLVGAPPNNPPAPGA